MTGKVPMYRRMLDAIEAAGPDGITVQDLTAATGMSAASIRTEVQKRRVAGHTTAGPRVIGGVLRYFHGEHRPQRQETRFVPPIRSTAPDLICGLLAAAGPTGVTPEECLALVTMSQLIRHGYALRRAGKMFVISPGSSGYGSRYFPTLESAQAYNDERRKAAKERNRLRGMERKKAQRAAAPKLPRKKHVITKKRAPAPIVLKKSAPKKLDPTSAIKAAPVVNPHKVRPVVLPSNPLWFEVTHAPQVVSANECRPWARYA